MTDVGVNFFVSYTSADRPWAEWIAWELEAAGYSTIVQAWDMQPGANFVVEMHRATRATERTIAVLSPAFLESPYCEAEWAAAFAKDPVGQRRALVPVRVRDCDPDGILGQIVYVDVVGLSEAASRDALLGGLKVRVKPDSAPAFPAARAGGVTVERVARPVEGGAAIFNVPVNARTFSGRARELKRLAAGLGGKGRVAVVAVNGIGGVGKTQLVARYARTHRDDYDVVWWVRAEQPHTLRSDLAALAARLALPEASGSDEQATIDALRTWLERNARWLVIFDNVPSPDAVAGELVDADAGHVLITSRAFADWGRVAAKSLRLDVWSPAEARVFLRARTGERDRVVLDAVAEALGHLPLALEQAAAYSTTLAITLGGYVKRLRDRAPELFASGRPVDYEHTVATVWQLSFEQLEDDPAAGELLGVCAQLGAERIPRELLRAAAAHTTPTIIDGAQLDGAIATLLGYALLTPATNETLGMHRLIAQQLRGSAPAAAHARHVEAAIRALLELWPQRSWEHEYWPVCGRLLAHALGATDHAERDAIANTHTAVLLARVGQYQRARAEYAAARRLTERALAIFEAVYGPEHPEVAITLGNLGIVQQQLGEFEAARATQQRALKIFEAVYGPEHPEVASTLGNLGIVQEQLGGFEAARATQQRALKIFEAVYGPEHPEVASTLGNLGIVQEQLGGFEAARATQQRALKIKEAVYGSEHPEVARTLGNLGIVQGQLGQLEAARATQQRALKIKEAVYGSEHPEVARTLGNLGIVQEQLGEFEAARATQQRALKIFEAVYGGEHPTVAMTLVHLGNVLRELGDPNRALHLQQRALAIETATYGSEHHEVAATRAEISTTRQQLSAP